MKDLIDIVILFLTMKISWGLPEDVEIALWLWFTGFFIILGSICALIVFMKRKIKELTN